MRIRGVGKINRGLQLQIHALLVTVARHGFHFQWRKEYQRLRIILFNQLAAAFQGRLQQVYPRRQSRQFQAEDQRISLPAEFIPRARMRGFQPRFCPDVIQQFPLHRRLGSGIPGRYPDGNRYIGFRTEKQLVVRRILKNQPAVRRRPIVDHLRGKTPVLGGCPLRQIAGASPLAAIPHRQLRPFRVVLRPPLPARAAVQKYPPARIKHHRALEPAIGKRVIARHAHA